MEDPVDEFEPLFDYTRVQPEYVEDLDDDTEDLGEIFGFKKKSDAKSGIIDVLEEDDVKVSKVVVVEEKEEDWLPPPPKKPAYHGVLSDDSMLQALRRKREELAALAFSATDIVQEVKIPAKDSVGDRVKHVLNDEVAKESVFPDRREKIVLSIQDKNVLKQFRIYKDDMFEKLFKMYAEKFKIDLKQLVFTFDGDKVSPNATPAGLAMENEDIIEVDCKPNRC